MSKLYKNLIGLQFSKLTVIDLHSTVFDGRHSYERYWLCKCECGKEKIATGKCLKGGNTRSCGCLQDEYHKGRITHGLRKHPLYQVWYNMIDRCTNIGRKDYHNYGGRGITVCEGWKDVTNFYNWAIANGWRPGMDNDRRDNDGNYCPENCHFVTPQQNSLNRRDTFYVEYNGERVAASNLAKLHNISPKTFRNRIKKGWGVDRAIAEKVRGWSKVN